MASKKGGTLIVKFQERYIEYPWAATNFVADRFYRKLVAESDWFENIISHNPTVGSFYESLLRNALTEILPSNHKVGTGFIFNSVSEQHGKQIDILVYDDTDIGVLYRSDEFVIIYPGSVIGVCEVKKTMNSTEAKKIIKSTFYDSMGTYEWGINGPQKLSIYSFSCNVSIETLFKSICKTIEEKLNEKEKNGVYQVVENVVLPQFYFLDQTYFIESKLIESEKGSYKILLYLHELDKDHSTGHFLSGLLREGQTKTDSREKRFLAQRLRNMPKDEYTSKNRILLKRKLPIVELEKIFYRDGAVFQEFYNLNDDIYPLSVYIPSAINVDKIDSFIDLLNLDGVLIEYYIVNDELRKQEGTGKIISHGESVINYLPRK